MSFTEYNGAMTVTTVGKEPVAYFIRTDINQIAVLDTVSSGIAVDFAVYRHRPVATSGDRDKSLRVKRVSVYGTGIITSAQMYIVAENARAEAYPYSSGCAVPSEGILWQQYSMGLRGRWIDTLIFWQGTDVRITQVQVEVVPIG